MQQHFEQLQEKMKITKPYDFKKIFDPHLPVMPVVSLNSESLVAPFMDTLLENDIHLIEVTLRSPNALKIIENISKSYPEIVLGAGTLTVARQFKQVKNAGGQFVVSPGYTNELAKAAQSSNLPFIPGVATASEIIHARQSGYNILKFFPAELSGGSKFVKAMQGPFADVQFCPTGGINLKNLNDYLSLENVFCVGASWITPQNLIEQQDWKKISERISEMKSIMTVD